MKNAGASIRIGRLGKYDARWFGTLSLKSGHPYANWLSQLLVMTAGRKSLFWAFWAILLRTSGASILILRPPAALACPHYYRISLPTTARNTLNLSDWFCADCVHTALSCNVGSFSTECRDKPGLVGGIAVAAFIKKPLEHEFRYSAQLLAFAMTVCRLSKLDRKRHACVKLKYLEYAIWIFELKPNWTFQTVSGF